MATAAISLIGDAETLALLDAMKGPVANRVMRRAIDRGLTVIAKEARKLAPGSEHHRLRRMIGTEVKTTNKKNILGYVHVEDHPSDTIQLQGRQVNFSAVGAMLEFGTPHIAARSFIRAARDAKGTEALAVVRAVAEERIEAEWEKASKRGKSAWK